jgi:hypothetical protein
VHSTAREGETALHSPAKAAFFDELGVHVHLCGDVAV